MSSRTLAALSSSIFAGLGLAGASNELGITENSAERECLLLIDGMGQMALEKYSSEFPIFKDLNSLENLTSHFPSTTATNLTSLGTGVLPGVHGMLGYTVRVPRSGEPGRLLNSLKWDERVDPLTWQKTPTLFERAKALGIGVSHIADKRYEGSAFTQAALRGADYRGANQLNEIVNEACAAMNSRSTFAYLYMNNLDHAGHESGVGSDSWLSALNTVAILISQLREKLPSGTRLWITADHGMINVEETIVLGQENSLMKGVSLVGGEPRARHIYISKGAESDVLDCWRDTLAGKVDVFAKEAAIKSGLFGNQVSLDSQDRMGDLIAIPRGNLILVDPDREEQERKMVGHHGGQVPSESLIPLLFTKI